MSLCLRLSILGWICYPRGLCLRNRQMMTEVSIFCHPARPRRGQEECGMNHVPGRGAYSSLAPRCAASTLAAWAQITPQGKGTGSQRRMESHRDPEVVRSIVVAEQCAQKETLALDARRVCTRMEFKNSNRTLSVFKDSCERFVCPKPKSRSLSVINTLR